MTDLVKQPVKNEQQRLSDGWFAQQGASNPSGLINALPAMVGGCVEEGVQAEEDTGIGMVVHQLMYLQRDSYGHLAEAYDAWVGFVAAARALRPPTTSNDNLMRLIFKMQTRMRAIRDERGTGFGTNDLKSDVELTSLVVCVYVRTRADWFDKDSSAYSAAYDKCKAASEASR
jgi:hypothetical protein